MQHARWEPGAALERVMGIEPTYEAWEAAVLPLNYTRGRRDYRGRTGSAEARRFHSSAHAQGRQVGLQGLRDIGS